MTGQPRDPAPPPLYVPSWVTLLILAGLGILTHYRLTAYPQSLAFWEALAPVWVWVAGWVGLSYLLTALLWIRSARERSTYDPVLLALVACGGLGLLIHGRTLQVAHDAEINARLAESRRILSTGTSRTERPSADTWQAMGERFERYAGSLDRATIARLRAIDEQVLEELARTLDRWVVAQEATAGLSPDTWLHRTRREDLEADRDGFAAAYAATRAVLDHLESLGERYHAGWKTLDLDDRTRRIAIAETERILQDPALQRIEQLRALEIDLLALALEAINTLLAHWGRWRFDSGVNRLTFEQPAVEAAFFGSLFELEMAAQALRRAEAEARHQR
ncbi:MAG: hypothetical protein JJT96_01140 [Opitutales bacterium]|nr:hypothetical protein [Opitutales bacterium]